MKFVLDSDAETRCNVWYFFILFPGGPLSTTTWYWLDGTSPQLTLTLPWTRRMPNGHSAPQIRLHPRTQKKISTA